jgi:hypothetical protein
MATMSDTEVLALPNASRRKLHYLVAFRTMARQGHLVVLRLGSVCFSVGVITSDYFYDSTYAADYSSWNEAKAFSPQEGPWDLQHARKVKWYGLTDRRALCCFRKGIYGGPQRFCRLGNGGKDICVSAKRRLDEYLQDLGYNNQNGDEVLKKIGKPCTKINEFGFPTPAPNT